MAGLTRKDLLAAKKDASRTLAEAAVTTPYIFPEYAEWEGRKRELERAAKLLEVAEAAWLKRLAPALEDPALRTLAERRGLVPAQDGKGE